MSTSLEALVYGCTDRMGGDTFGSDLGYEDDRIFVCPWLFDELKHQSKSVFLSLTPRGVTFPIKKMYPAFYWWISTAMEPIKSLQAQAYTEW